MPEKRDAPTIGDAILRRSDRVRYSETPPTEKLEAVGKASLKKGKLGAILRKMGEDDVK
jgi:hypothetical protein